MISLQLRITCYRHKWKDHYCCGYILNLVFCSHGEMVEHFIGVYIINRTLHGLLEIRNFSWRVEKYFMSERLEQVIFQHSKENFASPRGHVISSISHFIKPIFYLMFLRLNALYKKCNTGLPFFSFVRIKKFVHFILYFYKWQANIEETYEKVANRQLFLIITG